MKDQSFTQILQEKGHTRHVSGLTKIAKNGISQMLIKVCTSKAKCDHKLRVNWDEYMTVMLEKYGLIFAVLINENLC